MSEKIFEKNHKYIDFFICNVYSLNDIQGKKHYNVFIDYTAKPEDTIYFLNFINNKYIKAYNEVKKQIENGLDECERGKYSKISNVNNILDPIGLHETQFTIISDSTLLPQKEGSHIIYQRVFLDPTKFRNAKFNHTNPSDLLRSVTDFFSNDEIYDYFNAVSERRIKVGALEEKEYLSSYNPNHNASFNISELNDYNKYFESMTNNSPYPIGGIYKNATFDYDASYELLDENDRELLNIISEFRIKQIIYFKFMCKSNYNNSKLGIPLSHLDDTIHINYIKTFMGRRLYANYNMFMIAKEHNLSAKKLIKIFNNVILDQNSSFNAENNQKQQKVSPDAFSTTFWNNLKSAKTAVASI